MARLICLQTTSSTCDGMCFRTDKEMVSAQFTNDGRRIEVINVSFQGPYVPKCHFRKVPASRLSRIYGIAKLDPVQIVVYQEDLECPAEATKLSIT